MIRMIGLPINRVVVALGFFLFLASGCPRPAEAEPPFFEEIYFAQKPDPPRPPGGENWSLDRVLSDDVDDTDAPAVPVSRLDPAVAWRAFLGETQSESIGAASRGSMKHGRLMAKRGTGFLRKNDKAAWGTDETVALLTWGLDEMTSRYPGTVPLVIGDLSAEEGGRLRPHLSHQSGRDADVGYYFVGNRRLTHFRTATRDDMDAEKTWTFLELLMSTGQVQYYFIDRKLHKPLFRQALAMGWTEDEARRIFEAPIGPANHSGIIRHVPGHKHHVHIRFRCPSGDDRCR